MSTPVMVEVERVEHPAERGPHTVLIGIGREVGTPQRLSFVGDRRMMEAMDAALRDGSNEKVVAVVEQYQIIGRNN